MNARRGSKRCRAARQPWSRFSGHIIGKGAHVIEAGAKLGVEGIVSKQVDTRLGVWRRKPVPPPARHRLGRFSKPNVLDLDNWQIAYREAEAGYVVYPARDNTELRVGLGFAGAAVYALPRFEQPVFVNYKDIPAVGNFPPWELEKLAKMFRETAVRSREGA